MSEYDKTELNAFVQNLYDQKMQEGKHGHYETMFHCVHQAIARVAAPEQRGDTLTNLEVRALAICRADGRVSVSKIQRVLALGYNEAGEICQSIIDKGQCDELDLAPNLKRRAARGAQQSVTDDIKPSYEDLEAILATTIQQRDALRAQQPDHSELRSSDVLEIARQYVVGGLEFERKGLFAFAKHIRSLPDLDLERSRRDAAVETLNYLGYVWKGGEQWKPPLGKRRPDHSELVKVLRGYAADLETGKQVWVTVTAMTSAANALEGK